SPTSKSIEPKKLTVTYIRQEIFEFFSRTRYIERKNQIFGNRPAANLL
ncbi:hypothetical protein HMPREF1367_02284, partial [Enterococcus faecium ERV38]